MFIVQHVGKKERAKIMSDMFKRLLTMSVIECDGITLVSNLANVGRKHAIIITLSLVI